MEHSLSEGWQTVHYLIQLQDAIFGWTTLKSVGGQPLGLQGRDGTFKKWVLTKGSRDSGLSLRRAYFWPSHFFLFAFPLPWGKSLSIMLSLTHTCRTKHSGTKPSYTVTPKQSIIRTTSPSLVSGHDAEMPTNSLQTELTADRNQRVALKTTHCYGYSMKWQGICFLSFKMSGRQVLNIFMNALQEGRTRKWGGLCWALWLA